MASLSTVRRLARKAASSDDHYVSQLAKAVEELCQICERLQRDLAEAQNEARRAKREARKK